MKRICRNLILPKNGWTAANTRHRQLVDNSQALQAIADKKPAQESRTPAQDKLLARLADPQSNGFFHGVRPMDYVHTLCKTLQSKFPDSPVKHVFCGHQPRPLGRLTRSEHGLILAELDTQYTLFSATSYVIIPIVDPSSGRRSEDQESWAKSQVSGLAEKIKKYLETSLARSRIVGHLEAYDLSKQAIEWCVSHCPIKHTHSHTTPTFTRSQVVYQKERFLWRLFGARI